jgi:hypothetical protein
VGGASRLYVGGTFTIAAGLTPANRIAAWNGTSWSSAASGFDGPVYSLATLTDISGPVLFAAGAFANASGAPAARIASYRGVTWSGLGSGITGSGGNPPEVYALSPYDDGRGLALYVGGVFTNSGSGVTRNLARWDGAQWEAGQAAYDMSGPVNALAGHDTPPSSALFVGGQFITSAGLSAERIAKRLRCPCYANCDGSASVPTLNINDFLCFMNRFASGDLYANCDGSTAAPVLNINDYLCFSNRFAAGCP